MTFVKRTILPYLVFPFLTSGIFFSGCCRNSSEEDRTIERTVLVYMAADNNLSSYCEPNMTRMRSALPQKNDNKRLLVFVDKPGYSPMLLRLTASKVDTVQVYPSLYSTDPKVLSYIIKEMVQLFPSKHYGLVMWSHGTGWLPSRALHFTAPNLGYAPGRDGVRPVSEKVLEGRRWPYYETRSFGYESVPLTNVYGSSGYISMELGDMASAIPNGLFDFILFDACYMGNVEVAYALRNKASQVVSSCYEIVAEGFPYHRMTGYLLSGDMAAASESFYSYYRNLNVPDSQQWQRMAGVSVVETAGLDSLARCFKKMTQGKYSDIVALDTRKIQLFDRFSNHVFYDMEDMVANLCPDSPYLSEFRSQLARTISYSKSTDYIFQGDRDLEIEVESYCGLSIFIPRYGFDSNQIITSGSRTNLNAEYRKTEWSSVTGYGQE